MTSEAEKKSQRASPTYDPDAGASDSDAVILIDKMSEFNDIAVWLQEIADDMEDLQSYLRDPEFVRVMARDIRQGVERLKVLEAVAWQITHRWLEVELSIDV